jgi:UDP-N-acetylglucosamine--dolichyl-phosphate N-acetylglucosaminephosphotransferase
MSLALSDLVLKGLLVFLASFLSSFLVMPKVMNFSRKKGFIGRDVHKDGQPIVPEMGGLGILFGVLVGFLTYCLASSEVDVCLAVFVCCTLVAGAIGVWDYLRTLRGTMKTLLTVVACAPIVVGWLLFPSEVVIGRPELPFVGRLRLTIVYWALLPFVIAVPANAVNMIDTFNGVMPITSMFSVLALLISSIILGKWEAMFMCLLLLGALMGFLPYNLYPSRVFASDVGSLAVGAGIGAIAVLGRLEVVGIVALMPQIMNAFYILASVRGLLERRQIAERPTIVLGDNVIAANKSEKAPMTLANLILSRGPLREPDLVKAYAILSFFSFILALATACLMLTVPLP